MVGGGRYDIIEAEEPRGPRRWIGMAVLAVLLAVPVISLVASREPAGLPRLPPPAPVPTATVGERRPNILHPQVRRRDGREIINVAFPDGSRAEISYPAGAGLAALGARPAQIGWLDQDDNYDLVRRLTAPPGGAAEVARERPMLRNLGKRVTLWKSSSWDSGQLMLFDFDPWSLALFDAPRPMTFEQRMIWAENLRGRVTEDGYLVLSAKPPLVLGRPGQVVRGEQAGPQLWFGGGRETLVVFAPIPGCDAQRVRLSMVEDRRRASVGVCRNGFYIAASGTDGHVQRIVDGIRIEPED
ncbi:hypothetical protein GCM10010156_58440 [Planobispora rosea]|uniref:Uncharacterized protein n=1 Tax=Planobispora rosea TaxID=35762 RepID=A0A8J3S728_PLARO|nr:hypothetical protein [Planobispora rosea]GGS92436.1 hypothetical protein GCM10010156_58440 [Planobispora rosea]GIH87147.1 hypothetical protein Pro02_55550 [Planobispora rosea]